MTDIKPAKALRIREFVAIRGSCEEEEQGVANPFSIKK
jgi:hypothetical protein